MTNNIQKQDLNIIFYYCPIMGLQYRTEEQDSLIMLYKEHFIFGDFYLAENELNKVLTANNIKTTTYGSKIKQSYGR